MQKATHLFAGLSVWAGITAADPGEDPLLCLAGQQENTTTVPTVNSEPEVNPLWSLNLFPGGTLSMAPGQRFHGNHTPW